MWETLNYQKTLSDKMLYMFCKRCINLILQELSLLQLTLEL